jgi:branched-chain amino acid transport system permease protein|uniref:branched-chain amino acid ABC transporter permease n=1 Tax=Orrella sp. TaxID=1921583 RepID=UPI004047CEDE
MIAGSFSREALIAAIVLAILILIPIFSDSSAVVDFGIRLAAFAVFATSLNMLVGFGGMVSFGHALYFGAGAYSFGLIMQHFQLPIPLAFLLAVGFCATVAAVVGAICVRLKEIYFAFLTLAFQMLFHSIIISWTSLTGGDQGLMGGLPRPPFLGLDLVNPTDLYWFAVVVGVGSLLAMRYILQSPFGYTLRMVRDNPDRAKFLGVNVWRVKLLAFVLAGGFAGVGGIIMALLVSGAFPEFTYWTMSGEAVFMVLMGGVNTFIGPVLGAALLLGFNDVITRVTEHHGLALGAIILLFALVFKHGITDFIVQGWQRITGKKVQS